MNALTLAKLEAQLDLQIAKLKVERCIAKVDYLNSQSEAEPAAPAKAEPAAPAKAEPAKEQTDKAETAKEKTAKAGKKAAEDVAKVKAAAEKATAKSAKDLDVDTSDTTEVLGYREGEYNVLGNFANLEHLTAEEREPYIAGMTPSIDHARAMKEGVTHLDMVNEVIAALDIKVERTTAKLPESAGIKAIGKVIGADLLQHMANTKGVGGMADDAKKIYAALKAGA